MAIPSFYHPELCATDVTSVLSEQEGSHAVKSRRLKSGSEVRVFNGKGLLANGLIAEVGRRHVSVNLVDLEQLEKPKRRLTIATAIPKGDRQKVMLDMLTQLGAGEIIPLSCEYSVSQYSENTAVKWRRIVIEACKQSQNYWLPTLSNAVTLIDLLEQPERHFIYADIDGEHANSVFNPKCDQTVLIGPEGGFSEEEFAAMRASNSCGLRLGGHILRTEAAAIAACAQFNTVNQ